MPLVSGKSNAAFKTNVRTLMGEIGKSPHVQSRSQALAIAFSKKRSGKAGGGAIGKYAGGGWVPSEHSDKMNAFLESNPMFPEASRSRGIGIKDIRPEDPSVDSLRDRFGVWRRKGTDAYGPAEMPDLRGATPVVPGTPVPDPNFGVDSKGFRRMVVSDRGGAAMNPWMAAGGAAIAPHINTAPWYERHALRRGPDPSKGMLGGASPGRVDNLPIKVKSGSYVVPADIVSAIGQGNSQSGAKMMSKMFSGSKMNKYGGGNFRMKGVPGLQRGMFAEGGEVDDISNAAVSPGGQGVPIIAASGEFIIDPEDVLAFGDGNMKRGHDALDEWVKGWRKKHIKTLRALKDPKKD